MIAFLLQRILWVDCLAALVTGTLIILLSGWLSSLYGLSVTLVIGHGLVHLVYGAYSFSLAVRKSRPLALILLLVFGNAAWAVLCFVFAAILSGSASIVAVGHFIFEGLFVGGLAAIEWTQRRRLSGA